MNEAFNYMSYCTEMRAGKAELQEHYKMNTENIYSCKQWFMQSTCMPEENQSLNIHQLQFQGRSIIHTVVHYFNIKSLKVLESNVFAN